ARKRWERARHPRRRRSGDDAGVAHVSLPGTAQSEAPGASRAPLTMGGPVDTMTAAESIKLELEDIQSGALHERPSPYVGKYLLLRVDDRREGREFLRRLHPVVDSGRALADPACDAWVTVAFTYHGLEALGVPQESLDSFAPEFRQGMAARAAALCDVAESSPARWEKLLGTRDVHVALAALSPDPERLEAVVERARRAYEDLPGVDVIWRQDCYQLPSGRTSFGFKDGDRKSVV